MRLILCLMCFLVILPVDSFAADTSYWTELVSYIHTQQQSFHRQLANAIRSIKDGGVEAAWAMVVISFLYGIFHAAGPGHGKAIISTYLLTHESQLKKGVALSFASSFTQGLCAVLLVMGGVLILGWSQTDAKEATPVLEMVSFGLIAIIGLLLMKRAAVAFWKYHKKPSDAHQHPHHEHHDHHDHACNSCGHNHAPSPELLNTTSNLKDIAIIIFSIGIRPCSGSVLVLIFAEAIGLRLAGIASVFAISLGTAITVSGLAVLAVYFRRGALLFTEKQESRWGQHIFYLGSFLGGAFIALLGVSLFMTASQISHPLI